VSLQGNNTGSANDVAGVKCGGPEIGIEAYRDVASLLLMPFADLDVAYEAYITAGTQRLGAEIGWVSVGSGEADVRAERSSSGADDLARVKVLQTAYASHAMQQSEALVACGKSPIGPGDNGLVEGECYLAAPIMVGAQAKGAINFLFRRQTPAFLSDDLQRLVELLAWGLARALERQDAPFHSHVKSRQIEQEFELLDSAFEFALVGKALVDVDGRFIRVNQAFARMLDYQESELAGTSYEDITHRDDIAAMRKQVTKALSGKLDSFYLEKRFIRRDGEAVWALLGACLIRRKDASPRFFVYQIQDISEQKKVWRDLHLKRKELETKNRALHRLAHRDELTQLVNRRGFDLRFKEELGKCAAADRAVSLLLVDVDHFKAYNDSLGHLAGDSALQAVGQVLANAGRDQDLAARYGGEEFAVLLPNTEIEGCCQVAERVREAVAQLVEPDVLRPLTVSVGCATLRPYSDKKVTTQAKALLLEADKALYAAKAKGRNRVIHVAQLDAPTIS
jgi:diguanylate cyclase (GGDEF)-like protein/PAS domain S-box-containing protein